MHISPNLLKNLGFSKPNELHNLEKLWNRKRGQLLYVEESQIKLMNIWQQLHYRLSNSHRKQVNLRLNNEIDCLTSKMKLESVVNTQSKKFVTKFFLQKLAPLSREIYKRKMHLSVFQHISTKVIMQENEIPAGSSPQYQNSFKAAKIWARLGNFEMPKGGVGGSYRIITGKVIDAGLEEKEESLGIFKPSDEDTMAKNNPKFEQKIKYIFGKTLFFPLAKLSLECVGGQAYIAEAASRKIERFVCNAVEEYNRLTAEKTPDFLKNVQLVPDTQIATISLGTRKERIGSFQLWVNEPHQFASEFIKTKRNYDCGKMTEVNMKDKLPQELFDLFVIIDYLTANHDRHADNWFVLFDEKLHAIGLRLIDGGWSMAPEHPRSWNIFELRNQYLWKKLPLADQGFSELGKFVINYIFEHKAEIASDIEKLYNTQLPQEENKNKNRINKMIDRFHVLQVSKDAATKKELAKIRTHTQITKAL